MGNVLAASSPGPPPTASGPGSGLVSVPPGFTMPPVTGLVPSVQDRSAEEKCDQLPNPGTFEECHRKCKELFPIQMEGVKLTVNKGLSNHFQVNHTVALSTVGDSNYHFGATYVGTKQLSPTEAFPVLVGDMDNSGSLNAQIIHQLTNKIRSKVAFQTQQAKFVNWQVDSEFRGTDFTAAVTLGNPDILVGSGEQLASSWFLFLLLPSGLAWPVNSVPDLFWQGCPVWGGGKKVPPGMVLNSPLPLHLHSTGILVAHYLQSITPCLALGGELVYHRRAGEEGTVMSLAGKYTAPNWIATLTVGQAGAHATYYHKASDQLQVGVEFEASSRMQDTSATFGYQLDLPKANLLFRGMELGGMGLFWWGVCVLFLQ
uniref:Translocase of outer mitochondrial membrane 40 n=1 Tax=Laticauda laticaudata TaxID=8630 RepID=A0A8C5WTG9_LATLA